MFAIRIRKTVDCDTLHLPELRQLMGRAVEITIQEQAPPVRDELWAEMACVPETENAFQAQNATLRAWRTDPRFEPYWPLLDECLARTFDHVRKWATIQSQLPLEDFDYEAVRAQETCDIEDTQRRCS